MGIEVEGPEQKSVHFQQILDIFKGTKSTVSLCVHIAIQCQYFLENSGGGGEELWLGDENPR